MWGTESGCVGLKEITPGSDQEQKQASLGHTCVLCTVSVGISLCKLCVVYR